MKTIEIIYLILLFIGCFLVTELIVSHLRLTSIFHSFVARVAFQLIFYGLVYLLFDARDMARRLRKIEDLLARNIAGGDEDTSEKVKGQDE